MNSSCTIDGRWRLCLVASIIGSLVLLPCLNDGQNRVNPALARNVPVITVTQHNSSAQFPVSNHIQHLQASIRASEKPSLLKEKDKCNIFDGEWVYDPKGSPLYSGLQCPFLSDQVSCRRNGRPDMEYEKWVWEAKGCHIPSFDGKDMLERLRGKRVIIVGDSMNRNQWESLACLLYSFLPLSQAEVNVRSSTYKSFKALGYNCSVEFFWSPFLVNLELNQASTLRILRLDQISPLSPNWQGADYMVFNTGHWWVHHSKLRAWDVFQYKGKQVKHMKTESAFEMAMKAWANWVDNNVDTTKTRVYFRSISPEHQGKNWCYNITRLMMDDEPYKTKFPKSMTDIVEKTVKNMNTPVKYLNITKLTQYRRDAHPTIFSKKLSDQLTAKKQRPPESYADCSHWCLPGVPDTWNKLLYASIVLDSSGAPRQS